MAAAQGGQLFQGSDRGPGICVVLADKGQAVVVRLPFLVLGKLGGDNLLQEGAQVRAGNLADGAADGCGRLAGGVGRVGQAQFFVDVLEFDVAHFMADNEQQLVVVEHVHQAGEYPDGAVGHGKGVDLVGQVDLVGEPAVPVRSAAGQHPLQTPGVRVFRRGDAVLPVDLRAGGHGDLLHLPVAEGDRSGRIDGRAGRHERIDVVATGGEKGQEEQGEQFECVHAGSGKG